MTTTGQPVAAEPAEAGRAENKRPRAQNSPLRSRCIKAAIESGAALGQEQRTSAAATVYAAKVNSSKIALDVTSRVFDLMGAHPKTIFVAGRKISKSENSGTDNN